MATYEDIELVVKKLQDDQKEFLSSIQSGLDADKKKREDEKKKREDAEKKSADEKKKREDAEKKSADEKKKREDERKIKHNPLLSRSSSSIYSLTSSSSVPVVSSKKAKSAKKVNHLHIKFDKEDFEILNKLAKISKLSLSSVLRTLIRFSNKLNLFAVTTSAASDIPAQERKPYVEVKVKKLKKDCSIHIVLDKDDFNAVYQLAQDSRLTVSSLVRVLIRQAHKLNIFNI